MRTLREVTEILRDSMDSLKSRYPISWIGVFRFLELEHDLQGLLAVRGDLVSKKSLKPHIAERVLRQVVLV